MRFMSMIKSAEQASAGPPPVELMQAIAKLGEEAGKAGALVETGGLAPTATGARVKITGDKIKVIDGPFTEANDVIGGYAIYDVESKDEAIQWATRFMELHVKHWKGWEGEAEVRQMFGP